MDDQQEPNNCENDHHLLDIEFKRRDDLVKVVKSFYAEKGYILSIQDSRRDKYVILGCDRGGQYRDRLKIPTEERKRNTSTRLISCLFKVQGKRQWDGIWKVEIKNNEHNHEASTDLSGHPTSRLLSSEAITSIDEMTKSGIAPRQILSSLRQRNPSLQAVARNIYNMKQKITKESLNGRSMIQILFEELGKAEFTFDVKKDENGHLTHILFAHPMSIKLSRSYPTVFVMDYTYKTNRYKMPLLQIIGITSFNTSFSSCYIFLRKEAHQDYEWALNAFSKILGPDHQPLVIVTDRELALMNAIQSVFPRATNLLCVWHIHKNIVANCKAKFEKKEDWDDFLLAWNMVIYSTTEEAYKSAWQDIELGYSGKNEILNYLRRTWLPYKKRFVGAWTDNFLHFETRVSSRAEGAHSKLKKYLMVSTGDIRTIKEKMILLILNEVQEIKTQLQSERLRILHQCNTPFFREIATRVSFFALKKLAKQFKMACDHSMQAICTGNFTSTMGLPCAHMIVGWKSKTLPLEDIHSQWRIDTRASLFMYDTHNEDCILQDLLSDLRQKYQVLPLVDKEEAREKISQLIDGECSLSFEPNVQRGKGRPPAERKRKASSSTRRDPSQFEIVEASLSRRTSQNNVIDSTMVVDDTSTLYVNEASDFLDDRHVIDLNKIPSPSEESFWN